MSSLGSDPATTRADRTETEVGSVFCLQLPGLFILERGGCPTGTPRTRRLAASRQQARPLPPHPLLPQALQVLLLPRLHGQKQPADPDLLRRPRPRGGTLRPAASNQRPATALYLLRRRHSLLHQFAASPGTGNRASKDAMPWDRADEIAFECEPGTLNSSQISSHPRHRRHPPQPRNRKPRRRNSAPQRPRSRQQEIYQVMPGSTRSTSIKSTSI